MKGMLKATTFLLAVSAVASFLPTLNHVTAINAVAIRGMSDIGTSSMGAAKTDNSNSHMEDYVTQVHAMSRLLEGTKEKMHQIKNLATKLKELELADTSLSDIGSGPQADALRHTVAEAKAACDAFGPNSKEARLAWVDLQLAAENHKLLSHPTYRYSAAAIKAHHYYNAVVDGQLLTEAIDAVDSIQTLSRFVEVEKNRLDEQLKSRMRP
mmetsp:Transcript_46540/g.68786  ORF Transcript_46540/g.68786 Transcript_46540/m.68786 type:complete len:211 (-) Transcript_46540:128-760(-)|eukprot:CAMPEP_0195518254 /NCGR_PEP_ID=MMETSP0794_2-20130614/12642_1 /TAXON_ID=515487 /ORGANISM="Stephanopyxis turris, Strain CCMP 815" /LENGTH=210 /DNA_ID=CAMNT_0040647193 /DNA_START=43 /DNA_END=675 /DNA_ORIENTATION=-